MALNLLGTKTSSDQPVIDTPSTSFSSAAGVSAAITAIGATVIALLPSLNVLDVTEPVKVALIALIGAGVLAWAIASAGDSFARAYGLAHVTRTAPDKPNQPAIEVAAANLADAYAAAHGLQPAAPTNASGNGASAAPTSKYSPSSTTASKGSYVELTPPLDVKVRGNAALAIAVHISGESGKETQRYLVGLPNSQLAWVNNDAISLPAAAVAPGATSAAPVSTPQRGNGATSS